MLEQCPILPETVGSTTARVVAGLVLGCLVAFVATHSIWIALFLAADFGLRGFRPGAVRLARFSPLKGLAVSVVRGMKLPDRNVNAGPKVFAAQIGFWMSGLLVVGSLFDWTSFNLAVLAVFGVCAFLESAVGYCVGCEAYSLLQRLPWRFRLARKSSS